MSNDSEGTSTFGHGPTGEYLNVNSPLHGSDMSRDAQIRKGIEERARYGSNAQQQANETWADFQARIHGN